MLCEVTDKSIQEISVEVGYQLEAFRVFFTKIWTQVKCMHKQWEHWQKYQKMVSRNASKSLRNMAKVCCWTRELFWRKYCVNRCKVTYFYLMYQFHFMPLIRNYVCLTCCWHVVMTITSLHQYWHNFIINAVTQNSEFWLAFIDNVSTSWGRT
jgi:hypothetical protein